MSSYYDTLGVDKKASQQDIKRAYKKLAFKYHPDRNPGHREEATKVFAKILEAYTVLSDEKSRRKYDMFGTSTGSQPNVGSLKEIMIDFIKQDKDLMELLSNYNEENFRNKLLIFLMRKFASYLEN